MITEPRYEIGVDYDGVDPRHHQVDEVRVFTNNSPDRIFFPECGAFFTESLDIRDLFTDRPLVIDVDYKVAVLDSKATEMSGKEVCGIIDVNSDIGGVRYSYQYVGGVHMNGYYLLEQLLKMYPSGINAVINFDDLMNVPDEHEPTYHTQHVHQFYKTESLLVSLERLHQGLVNRYEPHLKDMYAQVQGRLTTVYQNIETAQGSLKDAIKEVEKTLLIQTDEYILTSDLTNPKLTRGYGNWQLITNAILTSSDTSPILVGSGSLMAVGKQSIIKNCYIWKNIENSTNLDYNVTVTADKVMLSEGESITFTVNAELPVPSAHASALRNWSIVDKSLSSRAGDYDLVSPSGILPDLSVTGEATVTVKASKDMVDEGVKGYRFHLTNFPKACVDFIVNDTSNAGGMEFARFELDGGEIRYVGEGQPFTLKIKTKTNINTKAYIKWEYAANLEFLETPPVEVDIVNGYAIVPLMFLMDNIDNGMDARVVRAYVSLTANEFPVYSPLNPNIAEVSVIDTSTTLSASVQFEKLTGQVVTAVNEGDTFRIKVVTNAATPSRLNLEFTSNKALSSFVGLQPIVITNEYGVATLEVTVKADFNTAILEQYLRVDVKLDNNTESIANNTMQIIDSSKDLEFEATFVKSLNNPAPVNSVNEGEKFYFVLKAPNYDGSANIDLDLDLIFVGNPSMTARLVAPDLARDIKFGDGNGVGFQFINGNTLAIEFTAIADYAIYGDATVTMSYQLKGRTNPKLKQVTIKDTSIPVVTSTWSSSATVLTPITQISELANNPAINYNNIAYLWLSVVGAHETFVNARIELAPTSVAGWSDVSMPKDLNFDASGKKVVRAEFSADFLSENSELLVLQGVASNVVKPLFETSILIQDTAFVHVIDLVSMTPPHLSGGRWSDGLPIDFVLNFPAFPFPTKMRISRKVNQTPIFTDVDIPPNTDTITIADVIYNPDREMATPAGGDYAGAFEFTRLSATSESKAFSGIKVVPTPMTNQNTSTTINYKIVTIPDGVEVTALDEGKSYQGIVTYTNPVANDIVVAGFYRRSDKQNWPNLELQDEWVIRKKHLVTELGTFTEKFLIKAKNDHQLNQRSSVDLVGFIGNDLTATEGAVYANQAPSALSSVKTFTVNDLSKVPVVTTKIVDLNGTEVTSVDEGDTCIFEAVVVDGTVGDTYTLNVDNIALSRFDSHEFGTAKAITDHNTTTLRWAAVVKNNWQTDGNITATFKLTSNWDANIVATKTLDVVDTSKNSAITIGLTTGGAGASAIKDDGTAYSITVDVVNAPIGSHVKLELLADSRPLTDLEVHEFGVEKLLVGGRASFDVKFKVIHKDATNHFLWVKATLVENTDVTQTKAISVLNKVRTLGFHTEWTNNPNNALNISSVGEGGVAVLRVTAYGGDIPLEVDVLENGGRSLSKFSTHRYGTYTRVNDGQHLLTFIPNLDGVTNTPEDRVIKVKLVHKADVSVFTEVELPVHDISTSTSGRVEFRKATDGTVVNSLDEGSMYEVRYCLNNPVLDDARYRVVISNAGHVGGGLNMDYVTKTGQTVTEFSKYPGSGEEYWLKGMVDIPKDGKINTPEELKVNVQLWDIIARDKLYDALIMINDFEAQVPEFELYVTRSGSTDRINAIDEGEAATIIGSSKRYQGFLKLSYDGPWQTADKIGRLDFGVGTSYPAYWVVPSKDYLALGAQLRTHKDLTTNPSTAGAFILTDVNDAVVARYPFEIRDTSKTPEITALYFAKDAEGLIPLDYQAPIKANELTNRMFYLILKTLNIDPAEGTIKLTFPRNSPDYSGWLESVDLDKGVISDSVNGVDFALTNYDVNTKVGFGVKQFKLLKSAIQPGFYGDSPFATVSEFFNGDNGDDRTDFHYLSFGNYELEEWKYDWSPSVNTSGSNWLPIYRRPPRPYTHTVPNTANIIANTKANFGFNVVSMCLHGRFYDWWNSGSSNNLTGEMIYQTFYTTEDEGRTTNFFVNFPGGVKIGWTRVSLADGIGTYQPTTLLTFAELESKMTQINNHYKNNGEVGVTITAT